MCWTGIITGSPSSNTSFLVDSFSPLILIAQFQKEQVFSVRRIALLMISTGNLHEHHYFEDCPIGVQHVFLTCSIVEVLPS